MAKKKMKTVRAGRQVRQVIYPVINAADPPAVRGAKRKCSTAAQAMLNRRHSFEKAQDLIAENFDVGDILLTLTYDDAHYPASRKAAEGRVKRYVGELRKRWRAMKKWSDPVIFWVTEEKHGEGRLHHHLIVKAPPGKCYGVLRSCWPWGSVTDMKKLRVDREKNFESIARYLCKEAPELGKHQWHITRSASRPDVEVRWVAGDAMIRPPKGSLVLASASVHDYQGGVGYQYATYIVPLGRRRRS